MSSLRENGILHSDLKSKADILNRQYCSVFNEDPGGALEYLGGAYVRYQN